MICPGCGRRFTLMRWELMPWLKSREPPEKHCNHCGATCAYLINGETIYATQKGPSKP